MFIEDEELRELYKVASSDHIETIESGLLHLEKNPDDRGKLNELLRATHSLKGDSRMLGVEEAEMLVHQMEDLLNEVQQSDSLISEDLCDRLYRGVDAVRKIAREAITGEPSGISVFHIIAQMMGAEEETEESEEFEELEELEELEEVEETLPVLTTSENTAPPKIPVPQTVPEEERMEIETVRVDFNKLDTLMDRAGELLATKMRLANRNIDISEIFNLWENWGRNLIQKQTDLRGIEPKLDSEDLEILNRFRTTNQQYLEQLGGLVTNLKKVVAEDNTRLESVTNDLESGIRKLRVVPLSQVFNLFPRMVRDLGKQLNKQIDFQIEGGDIAVDKRILEEIKDPLTHLIRNAIDHGLETPEERITADKSPTATLILRSYLSGNNIVIETSDNGKGLDISKIRATAINRCGYTDAELNNMSENKIQSLIFAPGFSTRTEVSEISGRGVGLDVVRANVERLKGSIEVESIWGQGCKFKISLPTSLSTTQVLLVEVNQTSYGIPIDFIEKMILVSPKEIFKIDESSCIYWQEKPLSVVWLADLLGLPYQEEDIVDRGKYSCLILKVNSDFIGVFVDRFLDGQNIILKSQSKILKNIPNIAGATILSGGEVCSILNPRDLVFSAIKNKSSTNKRSELLTQTPVKPKVLLVEDSLPIRTQVKRILAGAGYDVTVAEDGLKGFKIVRAGKTFDAVVSDVEMPNLSGLEMTARIREYSEYDRLPIILVTTLAKEEDKRRGKEAGANAYLTKGDFDQNLLLNTLKRLI